MVTFYIILLVALGVINIISLVSNEDYTMGAATVLVSIVTSTLIMLLILFIPELQIESLKYQTLLYCICIVLFVLSWLTFINKLIYK
jgi:hypothetical protein